MIHVNGQAMEVGVDISRRRMQDQISFVSDNFIQVQSTITDLIGLLQLGLSGLVVLSQAFER